MIQSIYITKHFLRVRFSYKFRAVKDLGYKQILNEECKDKSGKN